VFLATAEKKIQTIAVAPRHVRRTHALRGLCCGFAALRIVAPPKNELNREILRALQKAALVLASRPHAPLGLAHEEAGLKREKP